MGKQFQCAYAPADNFKETAMSASQLLSSLTQITGEKYIITDPAKTEQYRQGYRFGEGRALAVVRPGTILEMWKILRLIY